MNILLGVTGSIACYKSFDLARLLIKNGHQVRVILTKGALEFIKPETFRYLGIEKTYLPTDDFAPSHLSNSSTVVHIELAKWSDKFIIAPASANTIGRLSLGITNDLLTSVFLAYGQKPILIFPAMNTNMWNNSILTNHIKNLSSLPQLGVINPASGELACGDIGEGKFPEVAAVADLIECFNPLAQKNKKVLITAGATVSPLDPVRYLTNPSTGAMGASIAKAFLEAGYFVQVLAGYQHTEKLNHLLGHPHFTLRKAFTTEMMKAKAMEFFPDSDLYISSAAIADIEFEASASKLKKETFGNQLCFKQAPDVLKEVLSLKKHQKVISFAAETETSEDVFSKKIQRKPVDLMIGNKVSSGLIGDQKIAGFRESFADYFFVTSSNISGPLQLTKDEVGKKLVSWFEETPS